MGLIFESFTLIEDGSSSNPLNPNSDQQIIPPHDISPESNIKVMTIKEMITYWWSS